MKVFKTTNPVTLKYFETKILKSSKTQISNGELIFQICEIPSDH